MTSPLFRNTALSVAGLVALGVGFGLALFPREFYATSGVHLGQDVNLLTDIRAFGGGLVMSGTLIGLGAFVVRMTAVSLLLAPALYLSFGVTRLFAIMLDGLPSSLFLAVTTIELAIGLACLPLALGTGASPQRKR